MSKENNVAAPADDSKPRERSPYVLGVKPSTWDAQIAAQAGDEPIRAAMNVASQCRATAFHPISFQIEVDGGNGLLHELLVDAACAIEALAAQVSPHATADVEQ